MPICPECNAFFPEKLGLPRHDCARGIKSQKVAITMLQCDGTRQGIVNNLKRLDVLKDLCAGVARKDVFHLLLAPEFFFWHALGAPEGALSSKAALEFSEQIKGLSTQLGDVLVVPGTLPVADAIEFGAERSLERHFESLAKVQCMGDDHLPDGVKRAYLNEDWDTQQEQASEAGSTYSYRNVLKAFRAGKQVIEYDKQIPYLDGTDFEYHWFQTKDAAMVMNAGGDNKRNWAVVDGVKVGFEICAEHQYGTLMAVSGSPCDIHVLLSNSMEEFFPKLIHARNGGLFAHVDAKKAHCHLYQVKQGTDPEQLRPTKISAIAKGGFEGNVLEYEVELRIPIRLRTP
ncbi:hypothetical protein HMI50_03865 [Corallococcus carmarthensis]|nr:hypothetical protein [Corallococcus carmarthensis]